MRLLKVAFDTLGEPDALRFFIRGDRVALLPAGEDHPHSYPISDGNVSITWLKYELESGLPAEGRYELERDGDLWTVDFGAGPLGDGGESA